MIRIILLTLLLTGCGSSGGGSNPSIIVIGDSLCDPSDGETWTKYLDGYDVENRCKGGMSLLGILPYEHTPGYADYTIIAIGVNDAGGKISADRFELAYRSLVDVVNNPICLLPPFTDYPDIAVRMVEYHNRLITFCPVVLYATHSNDERIHYTPEADRANAAIVMEYLRGQSA